MPFAVSAILVTVRLSGLGIGASCSPLPAEQIFQYALDAGFPEDVATTMTAVAFRESGGCPTAYNGGSPPGREDSYGLWQINVKGNPGILDAVGISNKQDLFNPAINARAAAFLWGGNPTNLNTAWYLNRPGYQEAYLKYLPKAQEAAQNVLGTDPGITPDPSQYPDAVSPEAASVSPGALAGVVLAGLFGIVLLSRPRY